MLIIETTEAVENLEEIANVPGIDVLFIGAFDLCLSMGLNPFDMPLPEIDAVMERALGCWPLLRRGHWRRYWKP